jgi:hypothetical protein
MSRGELAALKELLSLAEPGGFTLPAELTAAYDTYVKVAALKLPTVPITNLNDASGRIVTAVTRGEPVDPLEVGRAVESGNADRRALDAAHGALREAAELAAEQAVLLVGDQVEAIISDCLRPAFEDVLEQSRAAARVLAGQDLDAQSLLRASTKVRTAYLSLDGLAVRWSAILSARYRVNRLGERQVQDDYRGLFSTLRRPMALFPNWRPPQPMPQLPIPDSAPARLLWYVGEEGTRAEPWLPTVAEQDAAWSEQFRTPRSRLRTPPRPRFHWPPRV